jgi:hypothetical protein
MLDTVHQPISRSESFLAPVGWKDGCQGNVHCQTARIQLPQDGGGAEGGVGKSGQG